MLGLTVRERDGGEWQIVAADPTGFILSRLDEHSSPIHATAAELTSRFRVKVRDVPEPDEAHGWRALAQQSAAASLKLARREDPSPPSPEDQFAALAADADAD